MENILHRLGNLIGFFLLATVALCAEDDLFLSTPEQIASLLSDPELLVGGVVSPISGQPVLRSTDLIVKGAQNIALSRVYIPPHVPGAFPKRHQQEEYDKKFFYAFLRDHYKGWQFTPPLRLELNKRTRDARIADSSGVVLDDPSHATMALSNTAGNRVGGQYDLRNTRIFYEENAIRVRAPDGTIRVYHPHADFYLLEKEILPNAKVLKYHYNNQGRLDGIQSLDPKEQHVYASLRIEGSPLEGHCHCTSTQGDVDYHYQNKALSWKIKEKIEGGTYREEHAVTCPPTLSSVSSPLDRQESSEYSDRFLLKSFTSRKNILIPIYREDGKVRELLTPSGPNDAFVSIYQLSYEEGKTTALRCDGMKTVFFFSKNLLPEKIQWWVQEKLKKEKQYGWDDRQRLKSIEFRDGKGILFYRKGYEDYDAFGNPGQEILSGDLTGEGGETEHVIRRQFSQDGWNLLLREEEDGLVTTYRYLPNTNLIQEKENGIIHERYEYDDCANLVRKVVEGSGQRFITTYVLRQKPPFLHLPEWIEESSQEGLIKKTKLTYDRYGNVCQEDVYGSDACFAYSIHREYDEQGNLLSETNPLGFQTTHLYDARGFLIESKNGSDRLTTRREYDRAGRLRKITEIGDGNHCHITNRDYDCLGRLKSTLYDPIVDQPTLNGTVQYDAMGRVVSQTDANQHTTRTQVNARGLPTRVIHPNGASETFLYAPNGRLHLHTDREGLAIEYVYDALGRVIEKRYLPIAQETFAYDAFHLVASTDKENHRTTFSYDGLGRKIQENRAGRIVNFEYDSLGRVVQEIHQNGENTLSIHRDFDHLGQLLEERKCDREGHVLFQISYTYDADGLCKSVTRYPHNRAATTIYSYDFLGRQVRVEDPLGSVTTTVYDGSDSIVLDPNGKSSTKNQTDEGFRVAYNSLNLPETITTDFGTLDARTTSFTYTPSGRVATKTFPSGMTLSHTYDELGYLKSIVSSDGKTKQFFISNKNGVLLHAEDSRHTIDRTVDAFGNILTEAIDGIVLFTKTYDAFDRPLTLTLFDKNEIRYTYDPLNLKKVERPGLYAHVYNAYDRNGALLSAFFPTDLGEETFSYNSNGKLKSLDSPYFSQTLTYDPGGRIENINSEIRFAYKDPIEPEEEDSCDWTYDPLGRLFSKTVDGETEFYLYDGEYEIARFYPTRRIKNLRVLGLDHAPVAIEQQGHLFIPILDYQGNVCRLIDPLQH